MSTIDKACGLLAAFGLPDQKFRAWASNAKQVSVKDALLSKTCAKTFNGDQLITFENFESDTKAHLDLLEVYGELLYQDFDQSKQEIWSKRYVLPHASMIDVYQSKLESGGFSSFLSLVESFESPVDRLQATHLSNAILANGVSYTDAKAGLKVKVWGPTEAFANCRVHYSLIPLSSAYCPVAKEFPYTFTRIVSDMLPCSHTDVLIELKALVLKLTNKV